MSRQYRLDELVHHGVKGQKWGRRRYQNADGSLTPAGKQRYGSAENFDRQYNSDTKAALNATKKAVDGGKELNRAGKELEAERSRKKQKKNNRIVESPISWVKVKFWNVA